MIGFLAYVNPVQFFTGFAFIILFCSAVIGFILLLVAKDNIGDKYKDSLFIQKYKVHKSKICPMVEFKE